MIIGRRIGHGYSKNWKIYYYPGAIDGFPGLVD